MEGSLLCGHLRGAPGEQVSILAQAVFDMFPRQVGEVDANLHSLARVCAEGDELKVPVRDWSEGNLDRKSVV